MAFANANPEKRFFIDLITRDISLEDAVLDLIDNAIDSLVRTKNIDLYSDFFDPNDELRDDPTAEVYIDFSRKQFIIEDNCGGISFDNAKNEVFRFGHPDPHSKGALSVFGIGMKRAVFKIGRHVRIESQASESGFILDLDVDKWMDEEEHNWQIPLDKTEGHKDSLETGTRIVIDRLRDEVAELIKNPVFENRLIKMIQETYPFYLGRHIRIFINNKEVIGVDLSFGKSSNITPAEESWKDGNVKSYLICGLLPRENDKWTYEKSGWYLVCNGRVIVSADKSKLTGWGEQLPQFMPKNRGFLGVVFFRSDHPEDLPWNTTKRGINNESAVFIRTLKNMVSAARSVIQFQNKSYDSAEGDELREEYRESVKELQKSNAAKYAAEKGISDQLDEPQTFKYVPQISRREFTIVQFKVKIEEMEHVKKRMGRTSMYNREVGERVFKYYLDRECSQ